MQGQFQAPPISKTNKYIIIALVAIFVLSQITKGVLGSYLALSSGGLGSGLIYQLITYPFIEPSFMSLLFESLLLWFIGSELEHKWGTRFYIEFLVFTILSVGPLYLLISNFAGLTMPLMGITGFNYALLVAYAIIYAERQLTFMLIFPMKAKYFCVVLAGIQLYTGFFSGSGAVSFSHLGAMLFAFLFLKYKSLKARGASLESIKKKMHKEKMRSKLKIVEDEPIVNKDQADPKDPKYWQ